jgi:sugar phosphate isomerase/epimerase
MQLGVFISISDNIDAKLKQIGYDGPLTIEREISGEQQIQDIRMAKNLLEKMI